MYKYQKGQALVLVLLSLAVVLTIVLFILSRSISDVSLSSNESQSISAFSAAEAGVEQALVVGSAPSGTVAVGDASYQASVSDVANGVRSFVYPVELNSGDTMTLWLKSQNGGADFNGDSLRVCWGKPGTASNAGITPAIETILVHGTGANIRVARSTIDPYGVRTPNNSFGGVGAGSTISGQTFPFCTVLGGLAGYSNKQFVIVRMFYNTNTSHPIGFDSTRNNWLFPSQGIRVDSSGTAGESSRRVQVFQGWPEVPTVFQYGLYSPSGLTK